MDFVSGASLILGGARSGKSRFAEQLAAESGRRKIYFATGEVLDEEMEARVAQHRHQRGEDWVLLEEPLALAEDLPELAGPYSCVLIDCLTLWLSNLMMAELDVAEHCSRFVEILGALPEDSSVLMVSNEVGQGIVPVDRLSRDFRDYAGKLHQDVAATVPNVWFVTAGLPHRLK